MWVKIKSISFHNWTIPIILLCLCIVSFGLLIPKLGFYWDDWETILVIRLFNLSEFWDYFQSNLRPFAGWTYILISPILGTKPINWHIFTLMMRYLSAIAMWWSFCNLWPKQKQQVTYAAFLFTVYPIFVQQPISVAYHQHWTAYALYFISIGFMLQAVKKPRKFWFFTFLSLLTLILHLSIFEYFIGVEFLRPIFIWIMIHPIVTTRQDRVMKTIRYWLPYLFVLAVYISWRMYLAMQVPDDPNLPSLLLSLITQPLETTINLLQAILQDSIYIIVSSWYKTFEPGLINFSQPFIIFSWGIVLISALGIFYFLTTWLRTGNPEPDNRSLWFRQATFVSISAIFLGVLPIWVTNRQASLDVLNADRFAMVAMFGASLLWVVLLERMIRGRKEILLVLSLFIGLAVGLHLRTANDYRWSWIKQKRIYWQLYWRAPWIRPQTALLSDGEMFPYVAPTFSFNLLYLQPEDTAHMSYWFYSLRRGFASDPSHWLGGKKFREEHRDFTYTGSSMDSLILHFNPPFTNCLWILRPDDIDDPYLSDNIQQALPISNLDRIGPNAISDDYPPIEIFGLEPYHDWCYYFQKADLARQFKDWSQIVELGEKAISLGYQPDNLSSNSPHEWIPFIEGYAYTGHWDEAKELTVANLEKDQNYQVELCGLWERIESNTDYSEEKDITFNEITAYLECAP